MKESNFLEPENEKFLQFLNKEFERNNMSFQIRKMVADKINTTDFDNFNISDEKKLIWYRNPILNSLFLLLSIGLLITISYQFYSNTDKKINTIKTDLTKNSHINYDDINKSKPHVDIIILSNNNQNTEMFTEKSINKVHDESELFTDNSETTVRTSIDLNNIENNDLSVIKNEIVNIIKDLNLKPNEVVHKNNLLEIESKSEIGYMIDKDSDVKYKVKFFISKDEPLKLKIQLIYKNLKTDNKSGNDVNNLFYSLIKNKIVSNIINKNN